MDATSLVDGFIKLAEHIGPCAALLLIVYWQNRDSETRCTEKLTEIMQKLMEREL